MAPLEFEVIPELALRSESIEFVLGMPLCQTVTGIQKLSRQIKGVELLYCQDDPLTREVIINLLADGIRLVFDELSQRLKLIEVYDLGNTQLRYCSTVFSSPNDPANVSKVEQCFGATHPGVYDAKQSVYMLTWRGLSFSFPMESNIQPHYAHGLSSVQLPENSSPLVSKMSIYHGSSPADIVIPDMPSCCYGGNCHLDQAETLEKEGRPVGISFKIFAEVAGASRLPDVKLKSFQREVRFGDTSEDVLSRLGSPSKVYYKSEDKMRIHRPSGDRQITSDIHVDYFLNYFTLGTDILLDAETHRVKKFVLHTNYPGHFDFGIYHRCNFKISLERPGSPSLEGIDEEPASGKVVITAFTKWEEISDFLCYDPDGQLQAQPVVLNRSSSNNVDNPFGSTFCYGFRNCIFEVMPNGHIATVTIFNPSEEVS